MKKNCRGALMVIWLAGILLSGCSFAERPNELQIAETEPEKVVIHFFTGT